MTGRRDFLRTVALGVTAAASPVLSGAPVQIPGSGRIKFRLGVASYTLRNF
ncbi:MAG: twin-arginine translocation signal domain-containing protein, partial [Bacteroidetes bacterium]